MAENQGGAEAAGQPGAAGPRGLHRRAPRRCAARSRFEGMASAFKTPSSDRFHWFILSDLEDLDCVVEHLDDELGADDA